MVNAYRNSEGLCTAMVCDEEYPARVAFSLSLTILKDFEVAFPYFFSLLKKS